MDLGDKELHSTDSTEPRGVWGAEPGCAAAQAEGAAELLESPQRAPGLGDTAGVMWDNLAALG